MSIHIEDSAGNDAPAFSSLFTSGFAGTQLWHVKHKEHDGTLIADIRPENLDFTLNREPPHTIQYEMSLSRPEIYHDFIGPYRTDFELWYGDTLIMAGPHTSLNVSLGDDHCTIYGKDWFHYLERRQYPFDPRPNPPFDPSHVNDFVIGSPAQGIAYEAAATDVATIIKNLLDIILARPHSMNITYPTLSTALGIPTNYSLALADTTYMADIIRSLSAIDPGFVYEILPLGKELRLYSPYKYDIGVVSDPSLANYTFDSSNEDAIEELEFTNNGPGATHLFGRGNGIGQVNYGSALGADANQTIYRRLDADVDLSEMRNRDEAIAATARNFKQIIDPQHEVTFKVNPDLITDFWTLIQPGYAIWFNIDLIAHQLDSAQEIMNMHCTVSTEGDALVDFGLQQVYSGTIGVAEG